MLATGKNVLFQGHNHLLTTGTANQHFDYLRSASEGDIKVLSDQQRWLAGGYDLEIGHF